MLEVLLNVCSALSLRSSLHTCSRGSLLTLLTPASRSCGQLGHAAPSWLVSLAAALVCFLFQLCLRWELWTQLRSPASLLLQKVPVLGHLPALSQGARCSVRSHHMYLQSLSTHDLKHLLKLPSWHGSRIGKVYKLNVLKIDL